MTEQDTQVNENINQDKIITFGCRLNIHESQLIRQNLDLARQSSGNEDIIVFNTCAVTKAAEKEAKQAIRRFRKANPNSKIIVTGCAAQTATSDFAKMPEIDRILGNHDKLDYKNYIFDDAMKEVPSDTTLSNIIVTDIMEIREVASHMLMDDDQSIGMVNAFHDHARAFVQVQNGCNHRCTFCIIPYARGNSRSTPLKAIVEQVKLLVQNGYSEVVLTGVDVTEYGYDIAGHVGLGQMISRLLAMVPELPRLRLSSIDVAEIDETLMDLMMHEKRLMPHFHISLQAGDDMILRRMKRRHKRQDVIDFCHNLRKVRPEVSFGADIIAGFPTETEEMFQNTCDLVKEADLQFLHVFPYSEREGTPAAKMHQIDMRIRKERAKILRDIGEQQKNEFIERNCSVVHNVLMENQHFGHTENFINVTINTPVDPKYIKNIVQVAIEYDKTSNQVRGELVQHIDH